jgi:anti-sigma B factor antagonist
MALNLQTQLLDDVAVIRCQGRIVLGIEASDLQTELDKQTRLRKKVVLNLAETDYMDSFGLGTIVRALSVLRATGGELKLCEVHDSILKVLRITNLLTVFSTYRTEQDALDAFSAGRRAYPKSADPSQSKILCIDTSADLLAYLGALLKRAGYEVFTSRYLGEALTLVKVMRPNLVICGAGVAAPATDAQVLHLPADFSISEAGQAGVDLLNSVQSMLAA